MKGPGLLCLLLLVAASVLAAVRPDPAPPPDTGSLEAAMSGEPADGPLVVAGQVYARVPVGQRSDRADGRRVGGQGRRGLAASGRRLGSEVRLRARRARGTRSQGPEGQDERAESLQTHLRRQ